MTIAVIQMVSQGDIQANLATAGSLLEQAVERGARLAVLPENFAALGQQDLLRLARLEQQERPIQTWLQHRARDLGLWIVAGTLPLLDGENHKPYAASLLLDDQGQVVARYDKLHLFDANVADNHGQYRESDFYARGQQVVVADTPVGRLGLSVCYDLRFPELYLALRQAGAELISVPAAFTRPTGAAHWEILIRARAIETQSYILAAAQGGAHPDGRQTYGHSAIVDPWGRILCELGRGEGVLSGRRNIDEQLAMRQSMPLLSQRCFADPCLELAGKAVE